MNSIRKLSSEQEFNDFADIASVAYPKLKIDTQEYAKQSLKFQSENPSVRYYGVFNGDELLGGMRFRDFKMNLLSKKISIGGIAYVAVHFLHKKEKIAKDIMSYYLEHYKKQGTCMGILYAFRPDFYKKMGFGYGTSMNQYRIKPANLPKGSSKANITYLKEEDDMKMLECYNRLYEKNNGLIEKYQKEFSMMLKNPELKIIGYKRNDKLQGYMIFHFKPFSGDGVLINELEVDDIVFENKDAFGEFMTFLNSQSDQITTVIFNMQDENFIFALDDPRNDSNNKVSPMYHECSAQGKGLMYRVIDIKMLFNELRNHNFNGETCRLKLTIEDNFFNDNSGSTIINFENGVASLSSSENYDVEISLDISEFSSLITCSVSFKSLYKYGRAYISNEEYVNTVNRIFASDEKPICLTKVF